jgi:hypothetical protein
MRGTGPGQARIPRDLDSAMLELTMRQGEQQPYLMGPAVLEYHMFDSREYVPYRFFANHRADGFQLPVTDRAAIRRLSGAAGFRRTVDPSNRHLLSPPGS